MGKLTYTCKSCGNVMVSEAPVPDHNYERDYCFVCLARLAEGLKDVDLVKLKQIVDQTAVKP